MTSGVSFFNLSIKGYRTENVWKMQNPITVKTVKQIKNKLTLTTRSIT